MKKTIVTTRTASALICLLPLAYLPARAAVVIGNLDGVSTSSTFDPGSSSNLPSLGWENFAGSTAMIFDGPGLNGALIHTLDGPFSNYGAWYNTGVAVQPNTTYTLSFDMGFVANAAGGQAGYFAQLAYVDSGDLNALSDPVTGTVSYAGNLSSGVVSGQDQVVFTSDNSPPGGFLAVYLAQTSSSGVSDFFGFDNVRLSGASAVPETGDYAVIAGAGLVGWAFHRRRKGSPTPVEIPFGSGRPGLGIRSGPVLQHRFGAVSGL